jgi:hypothetical protein
MALVITTTRKGDWRVAEAERGCSSTNGAILE